MSNNSANKRIAKNSIFMAIRMVFVLGLTLYTTRVILNILGVEDYGVYNVVCGFVSMFAFLNTSMSNGIQRFFNFELGKNGVDGASKVFNTALLIQFILAVVIIVLTESIGIWYLHNKMVIPDERVLAAEWIFQLSILSFLFIIMQAPFTAAIMAHERMDFYALVSVLDAVLKLGIVFAIPFLPGDKLIVYAILFALISVFNFIIYGYYCKKQFSEIKFSKQFDKTLFRSMLGFSGWNIFGSISGVMKEQGINLVLNLFFGPVVNAARGVAHQINAGLQSFVANITVPVRPQVVQSYAQGNIDRSMRLTYTISKFSCFLLYMISIPVISEIDYILQIWLGGNIPEHTNSFVIITILISFLNNLNSAISGVVHASGKMKTYQIASSIAVLSAIPLAYIVLKFGASPEMALCMVFISMIASQTVALVVLKTIVKYSIVEYIKKVITPILGVIVSTFWIPVLMHSIFPYGLVRLFLITLLSVIMEIISIFFIGVDMNERKIIINMTNKVFRKLK